MMGSAQALSISTHAASRTTTLPRAWLGDTLRIPDIGWTRMSQSQREHRADVSSKSPATRCIHQAFTDAGSGDPAYRSPRSQAARCNPGALNGRL